MQVWIIPTTDLDQIISIVQIAWAISAVMTTTVVTGVHMLIEALSKTDLYAVLASTYFALAAMKITAGERAEATAYALAGLVYVAIAVQSFPTNKIVTPPVLVLPVQPTHSATTEIIPPDRGYISTPGRIAVARPTQPHLRRPVKAQISAFYSLHKTTVFRRHQRRRQNQRIRGRMPPNTVS